jgi:dihydroorotase
MTTLIKNARVINEGGIFEGDILIEGERIARIDKDLTPNNGQVHVLDVAGQWVLPGMIDTQVHFREPGLTHKGNISTESAAAVLGGITSYVEQPNTVPQAVTLEELEKKYDDQFRVVFDAIRQLMASQDPPRKQIGFHVREKLASYRVARKTSTGRES